MASATARLAERVRAEDRLWARGERVAVAILGIATAPAARRAGRRLASLAREAVAGVAPFDVVVAVAWGPPGASPATLERRAAAAADAGAAGPGVVVLRDHDGDADSGAGPRLAARAEPGGGRSTSTAGPVRPLPFVGRAAHLAVLRGAWADVQGGTPRLVGVEGEAGIGKTALLRALLDDVDPGSVLWVAGDADEQALPFGLLRRLVGTESPHLSTSLREWSATLGPRSDPLLVGAGLLSGLTAAEDPVLVVVDDAHMADRQSLVALGFMARRLVRDPVLVVIAFREEARAAVGAAWERLLAQPPAVTVRLDGLEPAELMDLAAAIGSGPLSPAGAARLFEHTRGHPLYARMLLEQLPAGVLEHAVAVLPAPASLAQVIVSRLGSCGADARRLVSAAAVLGMRCDLARLATVAGVTRPEAAVREAVVAGLVVTETGLDGDQVVFTHPLSRAAIYHDLDPAERRRLHARAGGLLPAGAGLAHRMAAAEGPDGRLADELEGTARSAAVAGRLQDAATGLWRAFELTPPGPERDHRLLSAVEARLLVGDLAVGELADQELSGLAPSPWVDYVTGFLAFDRGRFAEAALRLERAWAALEAGVQPPEAPCDLAGRVATVLAAIATLRLSFADMIGWSARAGGAERGVTGLAGMVQALGAALAPGGDPLAVLGEADCPGNTVDLNLKLTRGMLRLWADELVDAHADLLSVVDRAARGEVLLWPSLALGALGATAYRMGRLDEAILYGDLAVATADETGRGVGLAVLHAWAGYPRAARGEWAEAEAHAAAAAEWAARIGMTEPQAIPAAARAAVADARGDDAAFLAAAAEIDAAGGSGRSNTHGFGPALADALARAGRSAEAANALARFERDTAPADRAFAAMAAARVRGRLAAAGGDWEAAAALFDRALQLAGPLGMPLESAKTHLAAGHGALAAGRPQPAAYHLYAALDAFDTLGADGYAAQVVGAIEAAGLAVRRRDRTPAGLLTPAEGAVARLVAGGLSNREVAARLFVSPKTVAYHLTHIYAKLGVSSRRALADQLGTADSGH